jgi:hypothetical protein
VTLGRGNAQAVGVPGSVSWESCGADGVDDTPWLEPEGGIILSGAAALEVAVAGDAVLFEITDARYAAAGSRGVPDRQLAVASAAGTMSVELPPPGDWVVSVSVGINDVRHGIIWTGPFYFRVEVAGS